MPRFARFLIAFVLVLLSASLAWSQVPSYNEVGYKPFGSYDGSSVDHVNLDNLNLSLDIPLYSLPQRGRLALSYSLPYTNWGFQILSNCTTVTGKSICSYRVFPGTGMDLAPTLDQNISVAYQNADTGQSAGSGEEYYTMHYTLSDSHGGQHVLLYENGDFRAADGSGWLFVPESSSADTPVSTSVSAGGPQGVAIDAQGTQYALPGASGGATQPTSIQDADGNLINLTTGYDSFGRSLGYIPTLMSSGTSVSTSVCPNLNAQYQPVNGATSVTVPGPNNEPVAYILCYASIYIHTDYYGGSTTNNTFDDFEGAKDVLQSVVLPNGTYWGFVYNSANSSDSSSFAYGDLSELILPTGGSISYAWQTSQVCEPTITPLPVTRILVSRTVNPGNGQPSSTWNYGIAGSNISPAIGTQYSVVISNPDGSQVVHGFKDFSPTGACSMYETATQYGTPVNGKVALTKTVTTQYQVTSAYAPQLDAAPLPTQTTTTWPNGQSSYSTISYDTGYPTTSQICYLGAGGSWSCNVYNNGNLPLGKVISQSDYDFSGTLLRQTGTSYLWQATSGYLSVNLLDTPYQITTSSPSGTLAQTTYAYDQAGMIGLSPSPAPPASGFSAQPGTVRGHTTTTTDWLNVGGSNPTTSTYWLNTGKVDHTINARGGTTSYTYDSTANFPAKVVYPATGSVTHQEWFSFDPNTGKPLWHTDQNGSGPDDSAHTTTYSYDSSASLLTESFPDGGGTSINYNGYANPLTVATTVTATPDPSQVSTVIYDGLGREETKTIQDSIGLITTSTTYDKMDRVASVSNPFRTTSDPSYGLTSFTYDVLNRKLVQTNPDSSTQTWSYSGSSATNTDENGNQWTHTTDALGRLTQVLEPNGTSQAPSMATNYTYDGLGNLLSVTQNGASGTDTPRTNRSFNYDSLSRLICSSNPENSYAQCPTTASTTNTAGTTSYTYDANGNLLTKVFPAQNGATGTQALGYCYDALNRLVGKWSAAPPGGCNSTPGTATSSLLDSYTYDSTNLTLAANTKGHLVNEISYLNGAIISETTPFNYDSIGRNLEELVVPYYPAPTNYSFLYGYDVAGNLNCTNNGFGGLSSTSTCANYTPTANSITATYTYDQAGRLSSVYSSGLPPPEPCNPAPNAVCITGQQIFFGPVYGPAGILSASYGNGLNMTRYYDNRMRVMDHEVFNASDTFGWATVEITGTEQAGDTGTVTLTVAGVSMTAPYGAGSTAASVALALVGVINQTQNSLVSAAICTSTTCPAVAEGALAQTLRLNSLIVGTGGDVSVVATSTGSSSVSFTATPSGSVLQNGNGVAAYYYKLQYAPNGNIKESQDEYNGYEINGYDTLNRLTTSQRAYEGPIAGNTYVYQCWLYDGFGNRLSEADQNTSCTGTAPTPSASNYVQNVTYGLNNQITQIAGATPLTGFAYDLAGNVINDSVNQYVYDAEGRICAVENFNSGNMTQYVYDAEGRRVAKGALSGAAAAAAFPSASSGVTPYCAAPTAANGFSLKSVYLRGVQGDQDTELDGSGNWVHTNVFAAGGLTATYWNNAGTSELSYNFSDWLGSKRLQTNVNPSAETYWKSDPWGDYLTPYGTGGDATEHHFTGKERDTESGNDYFGARYYSSGMGRWMSPDWSAKAQPVPYAKLPDPQTLNLYAYVGNNPLGRADDDGHDWIDPRVIAQFAHDVTVGAIRGIAQVAFKALSMTDNRITNPAYAHMQDMPASLQYSNTTQAVAGTVAPLVLPAFGGSISVSAAVTTVETESATIAAEIPEVMTEGTIFRAGGTNPANLTGEDLSFRTSLSNPIDASGRPVDGNVVFRPGKPAFGVDVTKLPEGSAVLDNTPPGHVTVNASPEAIKDAVNPATKTKFPQ